jgi:hypothetical protein
MIEVEELRKQYGDLRAVDVVDENSTPDARVAHVSIGISTCVEDVSAERLSVAGGFEIGVRRSWPSSDGLVTTLRSART